ncbi:flavin monoamine oxidase family protein [Nocardia xishanensis]|uniref:flavin monoamine oxidase family protein n=1 Tax=Nocardia xishanensis TaxID=238964 RepID=UPI00344481C7
MDSKPASWLMRGVKTDEVKEIFSDWAGQWIGCDPEETAATQLAFSIGTQLMKTSEVPNFALPAGGNQAFTDALADELGSRLRLGAHVRSVTWNDDYATVQYTDPTGPVTLTARRVIIAVPTDSALTILTDLPADYRAALTDTNYGRYILTGIFTKEEGPQRWDDYYGIATQGMSFQAIFNHAAPQRTSGPPEPGGALVCLAGGSRADELNELTDEQIEAVFVSDLVKVLPELKDKIEHVVVKRQPRVVPYWAPGRRDAQRTLGRSLGPITFAGDFLGDPSLAAAADAGQLGADLTLKALV